MSGRRVILRYLLRQKIDKEFYFRQHVPVFWIDRPNPLCFGTEFLKNRNQITIGEMGRNVIIGQLNDTVPRQRGTQKARPAVAAHISRNRDVFGFAPV